MDGPWCHASDCVIRIMQFVSLLEISLVKDPYVIRTSYTLLTGGKTNQPPFEFGK